jgi:hypothetical protein
MLDKVDEVPSLCTSLSQNHDFSQTNVGGVSDKKLFENPSWSGGSWNVKLFGNDYEYKNEGNNDGASWRNGRTIECSGDLGHHGECNYVINPVQH